jgi:hypothetical protein
MEEPSIIDKQSRRREHLWGIAIAICLLSTYNTLDSKNYLFLVFNVGNAIVIGVGIFLDKKRKRL